MRIVIICGMLKPGQDGVGDYSRRLADALADKGHDLLLVSLEDCETEEVQVGSVHILRCVNALSGTQSKVIANTILDWKPDWVSLQFVGFAYHPKGLIHKLTPFIAGFKKAAQLHIMFHELWIRQTPETPIKQRLLGCAQKIQVLRALKKWAPQKVHTSNLLYQSLLERNGTCASILSIFGNIAIAPEGAVEVETLPENIGQDPSRRILVIPFSQNQEWDYRETMLCLKDSAAEADVKFDILQFGRDRRQGQHWQYIHDYADALGWRLFRLGSLDETTISRLLRLADLGLNSNHIEIAQKSGAVVSMLEHGLTVICAGTSPESNLAIHPSQTTGILSLNDRTQICQSLVYPSKKPPASRLNSVADQFIAELNA